MTIDLTKLIAQSIADPRLLEEVGDRKLGAIEQKIAHPAKIDR